MNYLNTVAKISTFVIIKIIPTLFNILINTSGASEGLSVFSIELSISHS